MKEGCYCCRHWMRGTEDNPRSPYGDCLHPGTRDGNMPDESRWDDLCDGFSKREDAAE